MKTLHAKADYGLSGQYVARITGRDSKFTFNREFVGRKGGKRNESTEADVDEPGLYERCDVTKRGKDSTYVVILNLPAFGENSSGDFLRSMVVDKADAMKIAKGLDDGRSIEDCITFDATEPDAEGKRKWSYELLSAKAADKKQEAATTDTAIAACWAAMQALPTKDQKKVLAALKLKVTPKADETATESAPVDAAPASE